MLQQAGRLHLKSITKDIQRQLPSTCQHLATPKTRDYRSIRQSAPFYPQQPLVASNLSSCQQRQYHHLSRRLLCNDTVSKKISESTVSSVTKETANNKATSVSSMLRIFLKTAEDNATFRWVPGGRSGLCVIALTLGAALQVFDDELDELDETLDQMGFDDRMAIITADTTSVDVCGNNEVPETTGEGAPGIVGKIQKLKMSQRNPKETTNKYADSMISSAWVFAADFDVVTSVQKLLTAYFVNLSDELMDSLKKRQQTREETLNNLGAEGRLQWAAMNLSVNAALLTSISFVTARLTGAYLMVMKSQREFMKRLLSRPLMTSSMASATKKIPHGSTYRLPLTLGRLLAPTVMVAEIVTGTATVITKITPIMSLATWLFVVGYMSGSVIDEIGMKGLVEDIQHECGDTAGDVVEFGTNGGFFVVLNAFLRGQMAEFSNPVMHIFTRRWLASWLGRTADKEIPDAVEEMERKVAGNGARDDDTENEIENPRH